MNWFKGIVRFWKTIQIVLIYIVSILLVYFMFPREGKFKYEYTKNKPWRHENLVAPFDFPIYKTDQEVQQELDSLQKNSYYYFVEDTLVGTNMISDFTNDYNRIAASLGNGINIYQSWNSTGQPVADVLKEAYMKGIIERTPALEGQTPEQTPVMVVKNGLAEEYRLSNFFTGRSAYEFAVAELAQVPALSHQVLNHMNLNDYLEPNILYDEEMTNKVHQAALNELTLTKGMVQSGQLIIATGELVTQSDFLIIESLRKEYETNPNVGKNYLVVYIGQFLLITLIFLALFWFIFYFRKDILISRP